MKKKKNDMNVYKSKLFVAKLNEEFHTIQHGVPTKVLVFSRRCPPSTNQPDTPKSAILTDECFRHSIRL